MTAKPQTTFFNLIILDESGSMSPIAKQTISGCNETIEAARITAREQGDKMRSLMSIYAFNTSGYLPSRYIVKNLSVADEEVSITEKDYRPGGCTPLLDAVGSTLTELKAVASTHADATGIITIITDGMENSSQNYTYKQVKNLIGQFREMGWVVNLMGANIDVDSLGEAMGVKNRMSWEASEEGAANLHSNIREHMTCCFCNVSSEDENLTYEERIKKRREAADNMPF